MWRSLWYGSVEWAWVLTRYCIPMLFASLLSEFMPSNPPIGFPDNLSRTGRRVVRHSEMQLRPALPDIAKFMRAVIGDVDGMPEEERQLGRVPEIVKQIAGLLGYACRAAVGFAVQVSCDVLYLRLWSMLFNACMQ